MPSDLPAPDAPPERAILRAGGEPAQDAWRRPHWDLATSHGWLDAVAARRVAGARFALLRGLGAQMERRLLHWMLDLHTTRHGYTEIAPPLVASATALHATGHLPHFADEMYHIPDGDLWLNPTAKVPLVALHAGELLAERHLPVRETAGIPSFRREAGSAGRHTRGLLRLHQFHKVELSQIVTPAGADAAFEELTCHAEAVARTLGLAYRVVALPTADLGFAARRGRDLEIWFAGMREWIEVASISECGTFQSERAAIRYKPAAGGRPRFAVTLNASGVAVGRALAAVIEMYQQPDGRVAWPEALGGSDLV